MSLPPKPVFPLAIDNDYTLFLVYNTTQARLSANNPAWADEIDIMSVGADEDEIWPNNGWANINGEMFYYDTVGYDFNGKVNVLKRCARNLGGTKTQLNLAGVWVRGCIVAEHHNQLADCILAIEDVALEMQEDLNKLNFTECPDDHDCVNVATQIDILPASTGCDGTSVNFKITLDGNVQNYLLDFGDGHTTTDLSGTHVYALGKPIAPILTVQNSNCTTIITPTDTPISTTPVTTTTTLTLPNIPEFPLFNIPSDYPPPDTMTFPEIVLNDINISLNFPSIFISIPNFNFSGFNIPSIINVVPNIPSEITFISVPNFPISIPFVNLPDIPSSISFTNIPTGISLAIGWGDISIPRIEWGTPPIIPPISFGPAPIFPSQITFTGTPPTFPSEIIIINTALDIPSEIFFIAQDIPSLINLSMSYPLPSSIPLSLITPLDVQWGTPPVLEFGTPPTVEFGTPPTMRVQMISIISFTPMMVSFTQPPSITVVWGTPPIVSCVLTVNCNSGSGGSGFMKNRNYFSDDFQDSFTEYPTMTADIGIPSEIKLIVPSSFPVVELRHNIPSIIDVKIPSSIQIMPPENLPEIKIITDNIPESIKLEVPSSIKIDASSLPNIIYVEPIKNFPSTILVEGIPDSIRVVGIPDTIQLVHSLPSEIFLKVPSDIEIPLVYKGPPIPMEFTTKSLTDENLDKPCFMLVPCSK